ncbi:MAG: poly-gamma-glutamate hydrolase family protein [Acidobacteriia bacterium]|nr:poly-gamma-glutamate hydrolase family protein [Terriglobia bacterium]
MNGGAYPDFKHLAKNEVEGTDFQIRTRTAGTTLVLAPHGGGIEPGV